MESKKLATVSRKSANRAKLYQYSKSSSYQIKECDLEGFFNKLQKLEKAINKIIKDSDDNNKKIVEYRKVNINQSISKTFKQDNYPKQLISFYFIYQYFTTTPSIFSISEYYECMAHFNGKIPEYLTYAIMSKASLYSPSSQLYRKNLDYSNYYYELSVRYLNISMSNNIIDIYMLHALSILSWIDRSLNRQFSRFSRVATSTKIAQVLGLASCYFDSNSESINISQFSLKKLLGFVMADNNEVSKVFSIPKIYICKELELDCYQMRNEENEAAFIGCSFSLLPKEYYSTFKATEYYLNLKFTHISSIEKNLYTKSAAFSFQECFILVKHINKKYDSLPQTVRYSKECLNNEKIEKSPLLIRTLRLYQLVLKQISTIYGLMVRIIDNCLTHQIILLSQNISIFFEKVLDLLKDQQICMLKSSKCNIYLDSSHFFYYGTLLLDLIEKLNQEQSDRKCLKLKYSLETAVTGYNLFSNYIYNLKSDWEGSEKILNSFTERYESIKFI